MEVKIYNNSSPKGRITDDWDHVKVGFGYDFDYDRVSEEVFLEFIKSFSK